MGWEGDGEGEGGEGRGGLGASVVNEVNESQEVTAKNSEDLLKKDLKVLSNEASADVFKRISGGRGGGRG